MWEQVICKNPYLSWVTLKQGLFTPSLGTLCLPEYCDKTGSSTTVQHGIPSVDIRCPNRDKFQDIHTYFHAHRDRRTDRSECGVFASFILLALPPAKPPSARNKVKVFTTANDLLNRPPKKREKSTAMTTFPHPLTSSPASSVQARKQGNKANKLTQGKRGLEQSLSILS